MIGLTAIENGPYVSLILLILTKVDGAYREFHLQLYHQSRIGVLSQANRLLIFSIK